MLTGTVLALQLVFAGILMRALFSAGLGWLVPGVAVGVAMLIALELRPRRQWIVLDANGLPATGRDADRYAQWRASLCVHERDAWDETLRQIVAQNKTDRRDEP
ncbi:hypothetical protein [Branchiibius hedensis]|uniref:hypothetical protein n=1 Tax=Branchiibius hedensis TaxID=672460 RepID=UPI000D6BCF52|nr:hypothetical protein [Branchiibius hedensis]